MSTLTFPRVVADIDGNGWPWFAFAAATGDILWACVPELPDASFRWAEDREVTTPHVVLDEDVLAELLYTSPLPSAAHPTRAELAEVVELRLSAYRCRVRPCPEHNERHRVACCRAWAAELTGSPETTPETTP